MTYLGHCKYTKTGIYGAGAWHFHCLSLKILGRRGCWCPLMLPSTSEVTCHFQGQFWAHCQCYPQCPVSVTLGQRVPSSKVGTSSAPSNVRGRGLWTSTASFPASGKCLGPSAQFLRGSQPRSPQLPEPTSSIPQAPTLC